MSEGARGPLARWSERKHAARAAARGSAAPVAMKDAGESVAPELPPVPAATVHANLPADAGVAQEQKTEGAPAGARPPLPPVEELTADSDYTQFLADGVPEELTRAALRKLWLSDPVFAEMDGLDTYIQDFNLTDPVITTAHTSYQAGRGYLDMDEPAVVEAPEGVTDAVRADGPNTLPGKDASESDERSAAVAADHDRPPDSVDEDAPRQRVADASDRKSPTSRPDNAQISKG